MPHSDKNIRSTVDFNWHTVQKKSFPKTERRIIGGALVMRPSVQILVPPCPTAITTNNTEYLGYPCRPQSQLANQLKVSPTG